MSGRSHRKGEETVDSGQWTVDSGQWTVDSGLLGCGGLRHIHSTTNRIADDGQSSRLPYLLLVLRCLSSITRFTALCCAHLFALARRPTTLWNDRGIEWRS